MCKILFDELHSNMINIQISLYITAMVIFCLVSFNIFLNLNNSVLFIK